MSAFKIGQRVESVDRDGATWPGTVVRRKARHPLAGKTPGVWVKYDALIVPRWVPAAQLKAR